MDWRQYEDEIFQHFVEAFPNAQISKNIYLTGRYSQVQRQIDVLIEDQIAGFHMRIVVDGKFRNKCIDVTDVEAFIGYCADIGASKGVLISLEGYTPAAANRAHADDSDIELDVLNFSELAQFQAFGALPYSGEHGVFLNAPFGWVIDGAKKDGFVAALYQRGYDLKSAAAANEWMYINFWVKDQRCNDLEALINKQGEDLLSHFPKAKITYQVGPKRKSGETKVRCFMEESYPAIEYTGFVEFDDFIFFCVLFTPPQFANRNIRKLEHILRTVVPLKVRKNAV